MSLFHFHLITFRAREHIGTLELPDSRSIIPAGLKLTMEFLNDHVFADYKVGSYTIQATDDEGALVYGFRMLRGAKRIASPTAYLH